MKYTRETTILLILLAVITGTWSIWLAKSRPGNNAPGHEVAQAPETGVGSTSLNKGNKTHADHEHVVGVDRETAQGTQAMTPSSVEISADGCFVATYHHKSMPTHPSEDECSHHRNLITLPHAITDFSSVCIQVNHVAVRHERVSGSPDQVVIANVAGPRDTITARFCTGKNKCHDPCVYPKKEVVMRDSFIDAIGGTADGKGGEAGNWQGADAQKTAEVDRAIDGDLREAVDNPDQPARKLASKATAANDENLEVFKDWIFENEKGVCGTSLHAANK